MALNAKTDPTYSPKRINGKFAPGYSGNPGGSLEATRRSFNKDFLLALAADFKQHGASAIEKVRKQQPATYMKICALLVPRELEVTHSGRVKAMTDEQIEAASRQSSACLRPALATKPRSLRPCRSPWRSRLHRVSQGASVERRPRLPPCFPTSRARANSSH
jgi:hypothetical protein